ncbi:MAG: nickel pincer cofactor biosynthesis protein LarC [Caldilineaceae bacterium SB0661_bin_32]|uniref:Putative nickel insertion protein n=1 Tax=Caldilineaceae bacterium SB0661_bin_32 TaxID=2605255 RepID=A0A6B1D440_9CHLR|nr:nickel pincer cofactor biosynthesis protein LarC [Caldilineaceae bacterium SB0661_bin_32]
MPIAYLDTPSGISGDIFLACLVDAGWPLASLRQTVEKLDLPKGSWDVNAQSVIQGSIRGTRVQVEVADEAAERHLAEITEILEAAALPDQVTCRARAVFARLAAAEAKIHGTTPEEVHFHEVGALDAIIDIVGVCAGLHDLEIETLYASALPLGPGWSSSMHGRIPLPAPATLELLAAVGAPTAPAPGPGELVTPTGAALLAELAHFHQPELRLHRIGYGAGQKVFDWPNVARIWVGEKIGEAAVQKAREPTELLVVIETNIDDMNPELFEPVQHRLFDAGALDVWTTAIGMKKSRPGTLLRVLAPPTVESALAAIMLRETTTLGVRVHHVRRHVAERDVQTVATPFGPVRVKVKRVEGKTVGAKPEFDDCQALAEATETPLPAVYAAALAAASPLVDSTSDSLRPEKGSDIA